MTPDEIYIKRLFQDLEENTAWFDANPSRTHKLGNDCIVRRNSDGVMSLVFGNIPVQYADNEIMLHAAFDLLTDCDPEDLDVDALFAYLDDLRAAAEAIQ